ncbi:MAG: hypothetical protein KA116_00165 [Proteobacteria bacterium]|nr:hypothetical protein [Pseudomonadota bacterium]
MKFVKTFSLLLFIFSLKAFAVIDYGNRVYVSNMGASYIVDYAPLDADVQVYLVANAIQLRKKMPAKDRSSLYFLDFDFIKVLDSKVLSAEEAEKQLFLAMILASDKRTGPFLGNIIGESFGALLLRSVLDLIKHEEPNVSQTYMAHGWGTKQERKYFLYNFRQVIEGLRDLFKEVSVESGVPSEKQLKPVLDDADDVGLHFDFSGFKIVYPWDVLAKHLMAVSLDSTWDNLDLFAPSSYAKDDEEKKQLTQKKKKLRNFIKRIHKESPQSKKRYDEFFSDAKAGWEIAGALYNYSLKHPDVNEALLINKKALETYDEKKYKTILKYPESLLKDKVNWVRIALFHWVHQWTSTKENIFGATLWDRYYLNTKTKNFSDYLELQLMPLNHNHLLNQSVSTPKGEVFSVHWVQEANRLNFVWENAPRAIEQKEMSLSMDEVRGLLGSVSLTEIRKVQEQCENELID